MCIYIFNVFCKCLIEKMTLIFCCIQNIPLYTKRGIAGFRKWFSIQLSPLEKSSVYCSLKLCNATVFIPSLIDNNTKDFHLVKWHWISWTKILIDQRRVQSNISLHVCIGGSWSSLSANKSMVANARNRAILTMLVHHETPPPPISRDTTRTQKIGNCYTYLSTFFHGSLYESYYECFRRSYFQEMFKEDCL